MSFFIPLVQLMLRKLGYVDVNLVEKLRLTWRSLRSMASRCGWMRMGLRRSLTRDSDISADSLYSSLASSCRRKWVDFLTLQNESIGGEEPMFQ